MINRRGEYWKIFSRLATFFGGENFEGDQGALTFVIGVGLLTVGICFTPKLWKWIYLLELHLQNVL
ncbi:hypothetical protein [Clostridium vincentii]|uniref:Uncharacterized protein n=1 Tax=Clostridium vincentii TaxID=52704 RepID=A0A2T0B7H1_9CLOT|nr:hypothetical protein [Clostridium vincentii]PRR79848.1 hypothetical protein CLVI_31760 [Clostridium vincentii]